MVGGDAVTLITRPRRFGKTLNMSMLEKFFSVEYAGRGDLFEGLDVWKEEKYRRLQGTYPVIMVSFADVKSPCYEQARRTICRIIKLLYDRFDFLLKEDFLSEREREDFRRVGVEMEDDTAAYSLKMLSGYLSRYYGKKVIILLDEYDTPMQEAYMYGKPMTDYDAIIIEFKVQDAEEEAELADTVKSALKQIEQKHYEAALVAKGIPAERIKKYGFAFCGKRVLIG